MGFAGMIASSCFFGTCEVSAGTWTFICRSDEKDLTAWRGTVGTTSVPSSSIRYF
jgi:hypothetical protein